MKLKKIGISLRVETVEKYNEKRDTISHDWITFLQKIDYSPILIPNNLDNVENYLYELDLNAIILSGGDNVGDFPERDKTENAILNYAIKNSIPILGVCRGMQIINDFFDGKVRKNATTEHVGKTHDVDILEEQLTKIFTTKIQVNSYHNNLIMKDDIGKNLKIFATTKNDKSVEGYFHKTYPIIGVMWHPERSHNEINQQKLLDLFYDKKLWNT